MRIFLLAFLFIPFLTNAQWKYKNNYNNGFYFEWNTDPSVSANFSHNFAFDKRGFISASGGLEYILGYATITGEPNPWKFQNSSLGIPLNVSYNYYIGHFDQQVLSRIKKQCIIAPPKYNMEWFLEAGGGVTPFFFNKNSIEHNGITLNGFGGLRVQLMIKRPYRSKDLIILTRGGINPGYKINYPPYNNRGTSTDFYFSLGFGL